MIQPMSLPNPGLLTPAEYLALERASETRSEYIGGRMYAMSGASRRHNLIALNLAGEIRQQLRGKPCEAYKADMRVKVAPTGMYTYPDIVAVCGEPQFEDSAQAVRNRMQRVRNRMQAIAYRPQARTCWPSPSGGDT